MKHGAERGKLSSNLRFYNDAFDRSNYIAFVGWLVNSGCERMFENAMVALIYGGLLSRYLMEGAEGNQETSVKLPVSRLKFEPGTLRI
jgi:hypothetical protein